MKKIVAALMVTAFAFCIGTAFAKTEKCTVKTVAVEGEKTTVTMECEKDAEFSDGDNVQVKVKKKKVVEGC
jgi:2-methylaconitate cis-trans-isomerase PrpF